MSAEWKEEALAEIWLGRMNPDHTPRYRIPARQFWQLWRPRWQWVEGIAKNTMRASKIELDGANFGRPWPLKRYSRAEIDEMFPPKPPSERPAPKP